MEPDKDGDYKYHCKILKQQGLDPIRITLAEKCKLWTPHQKNLKTERKIK